MHSKMGDLELSLDDIIKKKLKKTVLKRNRNNPGISKKPIRRISDQSNRVSKSAGGVPLSKNLRMSTIKTTRGQSAHSNIADARNKIIQKQRQKLTDAREKLGQIAKQTDARLRLLKLRESQRGIIAGVRPTKARVLPEPPVLQRTVQSRINNPLYEEELMDYTNNVAYLNRNYPDRDIHAETYNYPFRARPNASVLFRTVENDLPHSRLFEQEQSYSWSTPIMPTIDEFADIPVSRINSRMSKGIGRSDDLRGSTPTWDVDDTPIVITKKIKPQETVGILKRVSDGSGFDGQVVKITKDSPPLTKSKGPARTLSERFCQEGNFSAQKINLLQAKLEASQKNNKINAAEVQPPLGHRIVVSNLVPSVTHEDVKELFEDIGELISSKVVRPGTAEVVYKLHKDAVRAVDVYHNRQLDGQPMKCLLVNNRSSLASKSLKGTERKMGRAVVEVDMTAFRKALHKKSTS